MTNEFRTLQGVCSNLVPQGPGYENITLANQVCTTVGSIPGESTVSGARFLELSYGFKFSTLWMVSIVTNTFQPNISDASPSELWHHRCFHHRVLGCPSHLL